MPGEGDSDTRAGRRRAFADVEAEESGAEGGAGDDDEEEEENEDDAKSLEGFIVPDEDPAGATAPGEGQGESESSSDDEEDEELLPEDLEVLQEAGIDISKVKRKRKADGEGAPGAPERQRLRQSAGDGAAKQSREDLAAELFGSEDDGTDDIRGAGTRARKEPSGDDGLFDGMSEGESIDNFIVEDPAAAKRRRLGDEKAEFGISEEQLQEVVDIFGDTSVLRPIDELDGGDETQHVELPVQDSPAPPSAQPSTTAVAKQELAMVPFDNQAVDPHLKRKLYESREDHILEVRDAPERWIQAFCGEPELLDREGNRRWTDEEHLCEAKWFYLQMSSTSLGNEDSYRVIEATKQILELLHMHQLEPIYVITQHSWQFMQIFTEDNIWTLVDYDRRWQPIWAMYRRIQRWMLKVQEKQPLPSFISDVLSQNLWESSWFPENDLKDALEWAIANFPEVAIAPEGAKPQETNISQKMQAVRASKYDEKLGIKESIDEMSLAAFGMTPDELGKNLANKKQVHTPEGSDDVSWQEVCKAHVNTLFDSPEAVREGIEMFLSHLIASDPRVRKYVRDRFWDMCAISTRVTEIGKPVAHDAGMTFRANYRAFHLVNRPAKAFSDELFLDVLNLQRQGFIALEYSLCQKVKDKRKEKDEHAYRMVIPCSDETDIAEYKVRLANHLSKIRNEGEYEPTEPKSMAAWSWCKKWEVKLMNCARAHEVWNRRSGAGDRAQEKAAELFKCAAIESFNADHLNAFMSEDPIFIFLCQMYCNVIELGEGLTATIEVDRSPWNSLRMGIIKRVLRDELYPQMWAEIQVNLARKAEQKVCQECCESLLKIVDVQPMQWTADELELQKAEWRSHQRGGLDEALGDAAREITETLEVKHEEEARKEGFCSVLVIAPEATLDEGAGQAVVGFVNAWGEPVDMRMIFQDFHKKQREGRELMSGSAADLKEQKRQEHQEIFKALLRRHLPAVVLILITNSVCWRMMQSIQDIMQMQDMASQLPLKPKILFGDPTVPRVVAYHKRLMEEGVYKDCEDPMQRIAISAARFIQDPLAEVSQLWHEDLEENGLLKLNLHRLQHAVPRERLAQALMQPMMEALGHVGVHINRVRRSVHLASIAPFIPGLGPRKARLFKKCLADVITSRAGFAVMLTKQLQRRPGEDPMKSPVVVNALPFIKIAKDPRDNWDIQITAGIDRTRLGEQFRPWAMSLCHEALNGLELPEEEFEAPVGAADDQIAKAINLHEANRRRLSQINHVDMEKVLNEVDFQDSWPRLAGVDEDLPFSYQDQLMDSIIREVLDPFEDRRQKYDSAQLDPRRIFHLLVGETTNHFAEGTVVHAVVRSDAHDPDVTQQLAEGKADRLLVKVNLVPSMVNAFFPKLYSLGPGETGYIPGCKRQFQMGETLTARVMAFRGSDEGRPPYCALSVDPNEQLWLENFPIRDEDAAWFVPLPEENWTKIQLGVLDHAEKQKKEALKDWVRRHRNIRHPNWTDADHGRALDIIEAYPLGNVLFRPSRRNDVIIAMLKVRPTDGDGAVEKEQCFRTFDVYERNETKTISKGFEIAQDLEVDGMLYRDFDEIIARHMDPISDNYRLLCDHPKFGLRNGEVAEKEPAKHGIQLLSRESPKLLHYCLLEHDMLPGHGLLIWTLGGKSAREEFIEIHSRGYSLWCQTFEALPDMLKWFKTFGCRHANELRREFKEAWEKRRQQAKERRGPDAYGDRKRFTGWSQVETTRSGLATPAGGGLMTPSAYVQESSAPTPSGLRSPAPMTATGGGLRTPVGIVPGSPAPMRVGAPGTPTARFAQPASRGGFGAPQTPAEIKSRFGAAAMTPPEMGARRGSMTPAGPPPQTPGRFGM